MALVFDLEDVATTHFFAKLNLIRKGSPVGIRDEILPMLNFDLHHSRTPWKRSESHSIRTLIGIALVSQKSHHDGGVIDIEEFALLISPISPDTGPDFLDRSRNLVRLIEVGGLGIIEARPIEAFQVLGVGGAPELDPGILTELGLERIANGCEIFRIELGRLESLAQLLQLLAPILGITLELGIRQEGIREILEVILCHEPVVESIGYRRSWIYLNDLALERLRQFFVVEGLGSDGLDQIWKVPVRPSDI